MQASAEKPSSSSTTKIPTQWLVSPDFKLHLTIEQVDEVINHDHIGWMTGTQLIFFTTSGSIFTIKLRSGGLLDGAYRGETVQLRAVDYDYKGTRSEKGTGFLFFTGGEKPSLRIQYQRYDDENEDMTSHGGLRSYNLVPIVDMLIEWNNL
jgi:hypothetical protein